MSVFVCGSLHLDVIVQAPNLPRPDETVTGQRVSYAFGGKGGNQAVAAARMGAQVAMAGCIGRDGFGATLREGLRAGGVDATRVHETDAPSGMSVAILDATGTYGAVIVSGANLETLGTTPIPPGTTHVLLQNEIPAAANLACAQRASTAGAKVILNAAPARPLDPALLNLVDILIVNRVEAADLAGHPDLIPETLVRLGPPTVIITLGSDGLLLFNRGETDSLPANKIAVHSTHGAGDAFAGALAAALDRGDPLPTACIFAQASAALHVSTPPAQRAGITATDAQRLIVAPIICS